MITKYLAGLLGTSVVLAALSVAALLMFASHSRFRQTMGHDNPSFERFAARVENGGFKPDTMMSLTNSWFEAQKQDHRVIQMEEVMSDRQAGRLLFLGLSGLLVVLFQTCLLVSFGSALRKV